jgi:NAD(P)-dependent dehydrogenase (short-subunit alcohol dehydrogenase family)
MSKALRVLITGAARGIGMATAQVLANRGHSVVATDISALSGLEGGKFTITGQPQVDDFSALLRSE